MDMDVWMYLDPYIGDGSFDGHESLDGHVPGWMNMEGHGSLDGHEIG